jgi:hypothetical protein
MMMQTCCVLLALTFSSANSPFDYQIGAPLAAKGNESAPRARHFQPGTPHMAATVAECQQALRDAVAICQRLFESTGAVATYHNTQWLNQCLETARTNFDNCRSTAGAG